MADQEKRPDSNMKRILIVEDEVELADLLSRLLRNAGYEVLTAFDGQEGLNRAHEAKPNLIIADIMMPVLDGRQMTRLLKFDKDFQNVPILMLTALGQEKDKKLGEEIGADAYIVKPFETDDLLREIKKLLGEA